MNTSGSDATLRGADPRQRSERAAALRFDAIVPRALVHRDAVAEVFLTDSVRLDEERFLAAAQPAAAGA